MKIKINISELLDCLLKVKDLKVVHLENNEIPKKLYDKYLPKFENKGLDLFSCYSEDEKMDDDEVDYLY